MEGQQQHYGTTTDRKPKTKHKPNSRKKQDARVTKNWLLIREAWTAVMVQHNRAPTMKELSQRTGLTVHTINRYFEDDGAFDQHLAQYTNAMKALIPDIMSALYRRSLGTGQAANEATRMFMELVMGYMSPADMARIVAAEKAGGNMQVVAQGGTINIISAVPDKDPLGIPATEAEEVPGEVIVSGLPQKPYLDNGNANGTH